MKLEHAMMLLMFLVNEVLGGRFNFDFSPQTLAKFRFDVNGDSHIDSGGQVDKTMNDLLNFAGFRTKFTDTGNDFMGEASGHDNGGFDTGSNGYQNSKHFGNQDDDFGSGFGGMKKINHFNNHQSMSVGNYQGVGALGMKGHDSGAGKRQTFSDSKVFKDNVVYGFGKTFDHDLNEVGGVKDERGHDDHNLDEVIDNRKGDKKIRGGHTHSQSRADGQNAYRNNLYNRHDGRHHTNNGKYADNLNKNDDVGYSADGQSVQSARGDSVSHAGHAGHLTDNHGNNLFGVHERNSGHQLAASQGGARSHGDQKYYGGAGDNAYLNRGGIGSSHTGGNGGGAGGNNQGYRGQSGQGNKHLLHDTRFQGSGDRQYGNNNNRNNLDQSNQLRTSRHGTSSHDIHNGQGNGYFAKFGSSGKSVGDEVKTNAGASAHTSASGSKHNLGEDALDKDTYIRNLHDRKHNVKNNRQFFHDRNEKGTNDEHLSFKRKKGDNEVKATHAADNVHATDYDIIHRTAKQDGNSRSDHFNTAGKVSSDLASTVGKRQSVGASNTYGTVFSKNNQLSYNQQKSTAESDKGLKRDDQNKRQNDGHEQKHGTAAVLNNGRNHVHSSNHAGIAGSPAGSNKQSGRPSGATVDRKRAAAAVAAIASIKESVIFHDPPNLQQSGYRNFGSFGSNGNFGDSRRRGKGPVGSYGNVARPGTNIHTGTGYRASGFRKPASTQRHSGGGYGDNTNFHSGMFDDRMSSMFDSPVNMLKSKSKSLFSDDGFGSFDNGFAFGHE